MLDKQLFNYLFIKILFFFVFFSFTDILTFLIHIQFCLYNFSYILCFSIISSKIHFIIKNISFHRCIFKRYLQNFQEDAQFSVVRDSSAVRRLFFSTCWSRGTSESSTYGKQRICPCNSAFAHFHVSWLSDFIFYPKPLYKSLHQSFFYSFITILPSESGVTLHYCTILP